jgi:hypothetical protein
VKLTIAITLESHTEVVLCGYEPGVVVVVGSEAPTIHLLIVVNWGIVVHGPGVIVIGDDDDWHGHGHGHWGGHGHGH